jgi:outer membrane protein with beta-barrel domain
MKKGMSAKLVALGLLALAAASASAQEERRPWYVGGALGTTHARGMCDSKGSLSCDQRAGVWSLFAGYRMNDYIAIEGGRVRPGTLKLAGAQGGAPVNASLDMKLWDLVVVASYPVHRELLLYGKAGGYKGTSSFSGSVGAAGFSGEGHPSNWTAGLGAELNAGRIGVRAEWQRFHRVEGGTGGGLTLQPGDVDAWTLQALFKF